MTYYCYCGNVIPTPKKTPAVFRCKCGRKWIWKIRSKKWVFAGFWRETK